MSRFLAGVILGLLTTGTLVAELPRGESIPAPGKKCPKCPSFPREQTIDGHPINLPEFVFPTKPSRVSYPVDKGPRPAPPRPLPPTSTNDP